jgi:HlyD family secretion protein
MGGEAKEKGTTYEFATVAKASIEKTISATGTLNPVSTITVRSPLVSTVTAVYKDYNDTVKKGDALAQLDTRTLETQYNKQKIAVQEAQLTRDTDKQTYDDQLDLYNKNMISKKDLTTAKNTYEKDELSLESAQADLASTQISLDQARVTSPIDGTVLTRLVSAGDSVSGGQSQAGTEMFTLCKDLRDMQIQAGVGEMDVPNIFVGQKVTFTLEALPGKTYEGSVANRYLMPTTDSNVNTYTVIINVDNKDGSLLPGMTCSVVFMVDVEKDVLAVPNAALRYTPSSMSDDDVTAAEAAAAPKTAGSTKSTGTEKKETSNGGFSGMMRMVPGMRGPPPGGFNRKSSTGGSKAKLKRTEWKQAYLWKLVDGKPQCMEVMAGTTDGTKTAIKALSAGEKLEGVQVIVREKIANSVQ